MFVKTAQLEAIEAASDSGGPLKIVAYAGSGKTSTLKGLGERHADKVGLYVAFNSSAAQDARSRMPANIECRTFHSLGWEAMDVSKVYGFGNVGNRIKQSPKELKRWLKLPDETGITGVKLTLRRYLNSVDEYVSEKHVPRDVLVKFQEKDRKEAATVIATAARKVWLRMIDPKDRDVQLPHDGYLKLWWQKGGSLPFEPDMVFLDEAQDMNPLNWALARNWGGQSFVVGDEFQQLYAFRGAINALRLVDFTTLYLSKSWRFGPAIAEVANQILNLDGKKEPLVGNDQIDSRVTYDPPDEDTRHTVLCRTNGGLLEEALLAAECGQRFAVVGQIDDALNLLKGAWDLYQGRQPRHPDLKIFEEWEHLLEASEDDADLKMAVKRVKQYGGRIPSLIADLRDAVEARESDADIIFSTVHKAKGMEWPVVRLANDFEMPYRFNKKEQTWKLDADERNVLYVAATRAKQVLHANPALAEIRAFDRINAL